MSMNFEEICAYIDSQFDASMDLWQQIVKIESPSKDKQQVDFLASHLDTYLSALGMKTTKIFFEHAGASLYACTKEGKKEPVALMGHMDTVHPVGSFGNEVIRIDGNTIYGPGVYDCKGGIVVAILVIRALIHAGYDERQLRLILASDEEVAHTLSKEEGVAVYTEYAKGCKVAFNCESALLNGDVITGRKGGEIITIKVHGVSAHAGRNPEQGASAIKAAAQLIVAIESMSDPEKVLFNCGTIKGGSSANVIPSECEFSVGLRFKDNQSYQNALSEINLLTHDINDSRIHVEVLEEAGYMAMEKVPGTDELFQLYAQTCKDLGYRIPEEVYSGGCSDASFVTSIGVPALCGVGVRGSDNHAKTERAVISSVCEQAKKIVGTILKLD